MKVPPNSVFVGRLSIGPQVPAIVQCELHRPSEFRFNKSFALRGRGAGDVSAGATTPVSACSDGSGSVEQLAEEPLNEREAACRVAGTMRRQRDDRCVDGSVFEWLLDCF